jgi:predicted nuclease of restriction endonuclease-like (RecB) superfamily
LEYAGVGTPINTRYFERGLVSTGARSGTDLAIAVTAESVLREPYILEFLGLPDRLDAVFDGFPELQVVREPA